VRLHDPRRPYTGDMSVQETVAEPVGVEDEEDFGADLSDDELGELLVAQLGSEILLVLGRVHGEFVLAHPRQCTGCPAG